MRPGVLHLARPGVYGGDALHRLPDVAGRALPYNLGDIFVDVVDMVADTLLICFIADEEIYAPNSAGVARLGLRKYHQLAPERRREPAHAIAMSSDQAWVSFSPRGTGAGILPTPGRGEARRCTRRGAGKLARRGFSPYHLPAPRRAQQVPLRAAAYLRTSLFVHVRPSGGNRPT